MIFLLFGTVRYQSDQPRLDPWNRMTNCINKNMWLLKSETTLCFSQSLLEPIHSESDQMTTGIRTKALGFPFEDLVTVRIAVRRKIDKSIRKEMTQTLRP